MSKNNKLEGSHTSTDVSSSLAEFIEKENILKEYYYNNDKPISRCETSQEDMELNNILQKMERLLSPPSVHSENQFYKRVSTETQYKTIEEILREARELVNEVPPSVCPSISYTSGDSSVSSVENIISIINSEDNDFNSQNVPTQEIRKSPPTYVENEITYKKINDNISEDQKERLDIYKSTEHNEKLISEVQTLKDEVKRIGKICEKYKSELENLKIEEQKRQNQWLQYEQELKNENEQLKRKNDAPSVSLGQLEEFQANLKKSNETIYILKLNLKQINENWKKKEIKLIHECDVLRQQLKNTKKYSHSDYERVLEQLKDSQESNVKMKMDFDNLKDKCNILESLCASLKKVILDEELADKLFANEQVPVNVKQYLSTSPSLVMNTLSSMFGCLSRSSVTRLRNNNNSVENQKNEVFTTNESIMINDLGRSTNNHSELLRELLKEKEQLRRENVDLNRQVKELESIVRKRTHPNYSNVSDLIKNNDSKTKEKESEIMNNLKKELLEKQHTIIDLKNQIVESKAKYDQNLLKLQSRIMEIQEDSLKMKEEIEKKRAISQQSNQTMLRMVRRKGRSCDPPTQNARTVRSELTAKEREVQSLSKQLDELKRTNKKLLRDKEIQQQYFLSPIEDDIYTSERVVTNISDGQKKNVPQFNAHNNEESHVISSDTIFNENTSEPNTPMRKTESSKTTHQNLKSPNRDFTTFTDNQVITEPRKLEFNNPQSLQQVISDLYHLLKTNDMTEKSQNSINGSPEQQEQLSKFISSLRNNIHLN